MNLFNKKPTVSLLAVLASCALSHHSEAQLVTHNLTEFQTVDSNGVFPATNGNNLDSFGSAAPFSTTAYVRSATSGTAQRVKLYLQFDLSTLTTEEITSATLDFSAYSLNDRVAAVNNPDLFVSQLQDDWAPGGTPDPIFQPVLLESVNGGSVTSGTGEDLFPGTTNRNTNGYSIDVTSIVQNIQDGDVNNGFILELNDAAGGLSSSHAQGIGLNTSSLVLRVISGENPTTTLSSASSTVGADYTVNVDFSEDVTGLEVSDFSVTNGDVLSVAGSGANYTVEVSPIAEGVVELSLPSDSVNATVGGLGNIESNILVTTFVLPAPPTVTLSATPGINDIFTVNVEFNEAVTGLELSDFNITNGMASDLDGTADSFTLEVVASALGSVEVTLPAGVVTDINDDLVNLVSNTLTVVFDPANSALTNFLNADLNSPVSTVPGTTSGALAWSFDPAANLVLFNGQPTSVRANQWALPALNGGFIFNPDGGANGEGDGAFVQTNGAPSQNPRAVLYFVDDNQLTTGFVNFGLDVFLDDNSEANPLQLLVEVYAWDDGQLEPLLSAGGPTANDPNYNLTDLGDAVTILETQVLATSVADATWQTSLLGVADVGDGYDNYAWRVGVLGATNGDSFAFDNVTATSGVALPMITAFDRAANGDVTIDFTSGGNVDVYRSTDLIDFGTTPIDANVAPGSYLDDTAAELPEAFYLLLPAGSPAP